MVEDIALAKTPHIHSQQQEVEPQNAREWGLGLGLFHEESGRKAYQHVASHMHHKLELISKGFLISKSNPYLGASLDNIQKCQCSDGSPDKVVEYKCPCKHRDIYPNEAFLIMKKRIKELALFWHLDKFFPHFDQKICSEDRQQITTGVFDISKQLTLVLEREQYESDQIPMINAKQSEFEKTFFLSL